MRRSKKAVPPITGDAVAQHPATSILRSALPGSVQPQAIETLKVPDGNGQAGVYRLVGPGVVAKHVRGSAHTAERCFYEELAISLGSAVPQLLAVVEEDRGHWLILEDVVGDRPNGEDPDVKRLVSATIAGIHRRPVPENLRGRLPERGVSQSVKTSRRTRALLTRMLSEADHDHRHMLNDLHDVLCRFEVVAPVCERALGPESTSVVHSDVWPKNIIVGRDGRVAIVDWEFVGFGPAALDYFAWDLEAYARARGWPSSTIDDLAVRSIVGRSITTVSWIAWSTDRAILPWPERALRWLHTYLSDLREDVKVLEEVSG